MTEGNIDTINDRNSLTPDDERQYDITFRNITKLDDVSREMQRYLALEIVRQMKDTLRSGQPLFCALTVKELSDKMLEIACQGAYATICEGHEGDHDYCLKAMMDLIMIIVRRYGGAISSQTLYQLLDRCDCEYDKAIQTIIDTGLLECSIRDDGDIACFYIPNNDLQQKLPL